MPSFNTPEAQAIVRAVVQAVSGYAVAHGVATNDQVTAIIGGVTALAAVLWSLYQKREQKKAVAAALATPVPAPPAVVTQELSQ